MCVIMACDTAKPTMKLLEDAEVMNRDGAGLAWLDGKHVRWEKGLNAKAVHARVLTVKLPILIHFRMATIGAKGGPLTHPFPIEPNVRLDLTGVAPGVMVHNGHWDGWKKACMTDAHAGHKLPSGEWSDSRGLAWQAALHGDAALGMVAAQRIAVLRPKEGITMWGQGWSKQRGIWFSNTYFMRPVFAPSTVTARRGEPFGYQRDWDFLDVSGLDGGWAKDRIASKYFGKPSVDDDNENT